MVKIIHDVSNLQIIMIIMDDVGRIKKEKKMNIEVLKIFYQKHKMI